MLHDDYLCLVESGKQQIKEVRRKFNRKTRKQRQLLSESGFVLRMAPPPLSRDKRIKMKKSIKKSIAEQQAVFRGTPEKACSVQSVKGKWFFFFCGSGSTIANRFHFQKVFLT